MIRILHAASVRSGNGKKLVLEVLINQIGGIYKPDSDEDVKVGHDLSTHNL